MAKTPISIGRRGIPALISKIPKVNRDMKLRGSWPTMEKRSPIKHIMSPLTAAPELVVEMMMRLSKTMAASSGGPTLKAMNAIGAMKNRVRTSLEKSPKTEAYSAISKAFLPWPFLVKEGPSNVVATAAPVPGMDTRMADMLPP